MRNFYSEFKEAKEYVISQTSYDTDLSGEFYFDYFLNGIIKEIITTSLDGLNINDYDQELSKRKIKTIRYIKPSDTPSCKISEDTVYINGFWYQTFINCCQKFVIDYKLGNSFDCKWHYNHFERPRKPYLIIELDTDLKSLIDAYYMEMQRIIEFGGAVKNLDNFYQKQAIVADALSTVEADSIYTDLFENMFLDNYLVSLIKKAIEEYNLTNIADVHTLEDKKVDGEFFLSYENDTFMFKAFNFPITEIDKRFIPIFSKLITDFINSFGIGKSEMISGENVTRRFNINTSLKQLIDAYYLEKERLAHLSSNSQAKMPNYYEFAQQTIDTYEDIYEEEVYSELFIKTFLDKYIANLIASTIKKMRINYKTTPEEMENILVEDNHSFFRVLYGENQGLDDNIINVTDTNLASFKNIVQSYLTDYNLGTIQEGKYISVKINTNLAALINSYYMEHQRLEYLSGQKLTR